jgi:hypothetical protein
LRRVGRRLAPKVPLRQRVLEFLMRAQRLRLLLHFLGASRLPVKST